MKKLSIIVFILSVITIPANCQWVDNYDAANYKCKESGKIMVIDFWADWCKPCQIMEQKIWNNPDVKIEYQNFVAVKINVDIDNTTPANYAVTGIPKVVITLPYGNVLWEKTGFRIGDDFSDILNAIPKDVSELYKWYLNIEALGKDSECAFNIARQFQQLAFKTLNKELRDAFILQDVKYFKKAKKDNTDTKVTCDIEVYLLLNDVCKGKADKALKKFDKSIGGVENCANKELAHFFLASCFKTMNDTENFNKALSMLSDDDFIRRLNE